MINSLAFFSGLGPAECIGLVILGILLYGKNLPTVAKTIGRTIGEIKRQMRAVEDQVRRETMQEEIHRMREADEKREKEKREREERERAAAPPAPSETPAEMPPTPEPQIPPVAGPAGPPLPMSKE